jgi:hypothetical protein
VLTTNGPTSTGGTWGCGFAAPVVKSLPLLFVSTSPFEARKSAVWLLPGVGALLFPSLQLAVLP